MSSITIPRVGHSDAVASSVNQVISGLQGAVIQRGTGTRVYRTSRGTVSTPIARFQPVTQGQSNVVSTTNFSVCRYID